MFDIGSYVSYRSEGVCKISDIRRENFGALGKETLYYVLTPIGDEKSTFFVPTDNEKLVSMMRKVLSEDEIYELIREVAKREYEWIDDSKRRGAHFKEILANGEREELVFLVRCVNRHIYEQTAAGKKVYVTDISAMKRANKLLFDEFSRIIPMSSPEDMTALIEKICNEK
ncbi:MAG: CarD family transcriptional regulator [Clostridia bacterium]|nr:CarD family transcriptional regulator [Clostridia bacterium]